MSPTEVPVPSDRLPAQLRKSSEVIYHKCTEQLLDKGGRRFLFDIAVTVSEIKAPPAPISPSAEPPHDPDALPGDVRPAEEFRPEGEGWLDLGTRGPGKLPMNMFWLRMGHSGSPLTSAAKADESILTTEPCASPQELGRLSARRSATCRPRTGDSRPGQKPVKKFRDRKSSAARIPAGIPSLDPATGAPAKPGTAKQTRTRKRRTGTEHGASTRLATKKLQVVELVTRPGGATLKQLMAATRWQAHSVRSFLSATLRKKMGLIVMSEKNQDGEAVYWVE